MRLRNVGVCLAVLGALRAAPAAAACPETPEKLQRRAEARAQAERTGNWPAVVDGEWVRRTFRFRPTRLQYARRMTVTGENVAIFGIDDPRVPAKHFLWFPGRDEEYQIELHVRKLLAADGGYITVDAESVSDSDRFRFSGCMRSSVRDPGRRGSLRTCTLTGASLVGDLVRWWTRTASWRSRRRSSPPGPMRTRPHRKGGRR